MKMQDKLIDEPFDMVSIAHIAPPDAARVTLFITGGRVKRVVYDYDDTLSLIHI